MGQQQSLSQQQRRRSRESPDIQTGGSPPVEGRGPPQDMTYSAKHTHTHTHQSPLAEERDTAEGLSLEGGGVSRTPVSALLVTSGWWCQVKHAHGSDLTC